jgi:2-methylcitrate dehydratase PrpD
VDLDFGDIERVEVLTVSPALRLARMPARNELSARFSLPYAVAAALIQGRADAEAFAYSPEVAELAERVDVDAWPEAEELWPNANPARVVVVHAGGERVAVRVDNAFGHYTGGDCEPELKEKFVRISGVPDPEQFFARLIRVGEYAGIEHLVDGML